jgi:hypothetical protein
MEIADQRTPDEPHFETALGYTHTNVISEEKGHQATDASYAFASRRLDVLGLQRAAWRSRGSLTTGIRGL